MLQSDDEIASAIRLHNAGELVGAKQAYEAILTNKPDHHQALHMLGVLYAQSGSPSKGIPLIRQSLQVNPFQPLVFVHLGNCYQQLSMFDQALESYDRAIFLDAKLALAHHGRGNALAAKGRNNESLAAYDEALRQMPTLVQALVNRSIILSKNGDYARAIEGYDKAIALFPNYAEAHFNRGVALMSLDRFSEALSCCDRALELRPDYVAALVNRGYVLDQMKDLAGAIVSYQKAIGIKPDEVTALTNLGELHSRQAEFPAALEFFGRALALSPNDPLIINWRAYTHLLLGNYQQGWRDFESRFDNARCASYMERWPTRLPRWDGTAALDGKSILLYAEQGFGDTIQFCRYAPLIAARGARVTLEVPAILVPLCEGLPGLERVVSSQVGATLKDFDFYCPLMSLPLAFNTTLDTIPATKAYFKAMPSRLALWKQALGPSSKPRIGFVWSGGERPNQPELRFVHSRRNVSLSMLTELAETDCQLVSLQKGTTAEAELERFLNNEWQGVDCLNLAADLKDFADTAAVIEQLDLVISVDTSVAHLAGALGKPVWILNRFDTCWRWLWARDDSPWYSSVRLFRQSKLNDWESAVTQMFKSLKKWRAEFPTRS